MKMSSILIGYAASFKLQSSVSNMLHVFILLKKLFMKVGRAKPMQSESECITKILKRVL